VCSVMLSHHALLREGQADKVNVRRMSLGEPEDLPGVVTCSLRSSGAMQSVSTKVTVTNATGRFH
jgi:hypothetical protein